MEVEKVECERVEAERVKVTFSIFIMWLIPQFLNYCYQHPSMEIIGRICHCRDLNHDNRSVTDWVFHERPK